MSFATEKTKFSSERFLLVRFNPSRYILPVLNAGLYEITLPFTINKVQRNGILLTKDTTAPSLNDHWYQNESTGLLQIKLASAPNDTNNVLIVNRYLFFTGTTFRTISEDPEDSLTPIREWQPRIDAYPTIIESFDNIQAGVFTIQDTQITLINHDRYFQENLTDDDSFFNTSAEVWMCLNSVSNIKKIFTGQIKSLNFTTNIATINCVDSFGRLKESAFYNDSKDEVFYTQNGFPNMHPSGRDKPCPYIVGKFSRWGSTATSEPSAVGVFSYNLSEDSGIAFCKNFSADITVSTNRDFTVCRQRGGLRAQSWGGVITYAANPTGTHFIAEVLGSTEINVGDTIKWNDGGPDYYGTINHVGAFNYLGNPYNISFHTDTAGATFSTGSTITNLDCFALMIKDQAGAVNYYPCLERDYTMSIGTTSGGNALVEFSFVNNFEANISLATFNPNQMIVYFRTSNNDPQKHGDYLKEICDLVDLPTNVSTFTAADTTLDVYVQTQIPNFDELDYQTYLKYVQDILASTLGYLKINSDFEVEYHLLEAPSSLDIRDNSLMLMDGTQLGVEYQDIATTLIAYNPHNSSVQATDTTPTPSETRSANKARWLNNIENTNRFRHSLETITDRIDAHIGLKSMRKAKYRFETASQDIDSELGNDIEMQNKIVLGTSQTSDLKIVTIEKAPSKTAVEASDFRGL